LEEDEELLKKEPMKGIGIEERTMAGLKFALKAGRNGNVRVVLLLKVYRILKSNGKEGNRMGIYFLRERLKSSGCRAEIRKTSR
jgi:hypothetical protein